MRGCSLLTGVLAGYVSTGFLTEVEAYSSPLFTKAKVLDSSPCKDENLNVRPIDLRSSVRSCSQALAQELSGFVFSVKVKMMEEGAVNTLRSVMKLCTQAASRKNEVTISMLQNSK